jgi:hypothetical protein
MLAVMGSLAVAFVPPAHGAPMHAPSAAVTPSSGTVYAGGGNKRLSAKSWAVYKTTSTKAKRVNTAALATWAKCRILASQGASSSRLRACLGDSLSKVVTEGKKVLKVLQGFSGEVAGTCSTALANLAGYIKLYLAGVNSLQTSLAGGGVGAGTGFGPQLDNARHALSRARAAQPPFEAACKPK